MAWQTNGIRRTLKFSITKTEEEGHVFWDFNDQLVTSETINFNFQNSFISNSVLWPALSDVEFARLTPEQFIERRNAAEFRILSDYGPEWNLTPEQWDSLVQYSAIYLQFESVPDNTYGLKLSAWKDSYYQEPLIVSQEIKLFFNYRSATDIETEYNGDIRILQGESYGLTELDIPALDGNTKYKLIPNVEGELHLDQMFNVVLTPPSPQYDFSVNSDIFEYGNSNSY